MDNQLLVQNSKTKGFTLIETLVYIALFGIILTGVVVSAYPLITGADKLGQNVTAEGEAAFALHKIGSSLSAVSAVSVSGGNTLTITPQSGTPYTYTLNGSQIEKGGVPVTATRAVFSNFTVLSTAPVSSAAPRIITVSFDVNGKTYTQTYHVFY